MAHRHRFALGICNCGLRQTGERLFSDTPAMNRGSRLYCKACGIMLENLKQKADHDRWYHSKKEAN